MTTLAAGIQMGVRARAWLNRLSTVGWKPVAGGNLGLLVLAVHLIYFSIPGMLATAGAERDASVGCRGLGEGISIR
eukprot:4917481-Pyramimonas_sp.AAC.1